MKTLLTVNLFEGPYYTYKTFYDFFHLPFADNINYKKRVIEKLSQLPILIAFFVFFSYEWPLEYAATEDFYQNRSLLYRTFFCVSAFAIFRIRTYGAFVMAEAACMNIGFGAYPKAFEPRSGHGPLKIITQEITDYLDDQDYSFETIESFNKLNVEKCSTLSEATRNWNKCIQYWLAIYVYKRFPSKKLRMIATMGVSAFWHGVQPGDFMMMMAPVIYVPIEKLCMKVLKAHKSFGLDQNLVNAVLCALKIFSFSYMGICFWLEDFENVWRYYSSVYHFGYLLWAGLFVACLKVSSEKKENETVQKDVIEVKDTLFAPSNLYSNSRLKEKSI